jgi:uncharacterized protein (UPF0264 family)
LQLLVSVRSADEVAPALAGGAQIIDAKEPSRGSLGPVAPETLSQILESVPRDCAVSVALGDFSSVDEVLATLEDLAIPRRAAPSFLKFGFAGVQSAEQVLLLLQAGVSISCATAPSWKIVAVSYADFSRAGTVSPTVMPRLAREAGAAAVLIDTWVKDRRGLLTWLQPDELTLWVARCRQAGLVTALAGSLSLEDLPLVCRAGADIVGSRGAVCLGGRDGSVSENRVRRFCQALALGSLREEGAAAGQPSSRNA